MGGVWSLVAKKSGWSALNFTNRRFVRSVFPRWTCEIYSLTPGYGVSGLIRVQHDVCCVQIARWKCKVSHGPWIFFLRSNFSLLFFNKQKKCWALASRTDALLYFLWVVNQRPSSFLPVGIRHRSQQHCVTVCEMLIPNSWRCQSFIVGYFWPRDRDNSHPWTCLPARHRYRQAWNVKSCCKTLGHIIRTSCRI